MIAPALDSTSHRPRRAGLQVLAFGAVASIMIAVATFAMIQPVVASRRGAERVAHEDLQLQQASSNLRDALVDWQLFFDSQIDATLAGAPIDPANIATGATRSKTRIELGDSVVAALRARGDAKVSTELDVALKHLSASINEMAPAVYAIDLDSAEFLTMASNERDAFATAWEVTSSVNQEAEHTTRSDAELVSDQSRRAQVLVTLLGATGAVLMLVAASVFAHKATRQRRSLLLDTNERTFRSELQQALEFANTEDAVYNVVERALAESVTDLDIELLIADSSRAHFSQVLATHDGTERAQGCGVVSPRDCAAARRAHTLTFASSEAITACPYLQDRSSGPCSAACVPVSVTGEAVGVMHATGANGTAPTPSMIERMEYTARRGAERVALIRTFATSESQAQTDPLTGLLNRRSLENHVRELHTDGTPYALAYGDLDHFKALNDAHGHEAGDRALRLFSRVLRDSVRPADLVSRYGGEEFVIVLPDCAPNTATGVLERVRERLALALTSGRVPTFTVSFGLASSNDAAIFDEVVALADEALLAAKAAGRNRVLVAHGPIADDEDTAPAR